MIECDFTDESSYMFDKNGEIVGIKGKGGTEYKLIVFQSPCQIELIPGKGLLVKRTFESPLP